MAKITQEQWLVIERRHIVDGVSLRELAKEYMVNESSLRRKLKPQNAAGEKGVNPLQALALDKVRIETERRENAAEIAALPIVKQMIVEDVYKKLSNISHHTACMAELGAITAHKLAGIANQQALYIDDTKPLNENAMETLQSIAKYTGVANEAVKPALNLLAANKDKVPNGEELPVLTLDDFYGKRRTPVKSSS